MNAMLVIERLVVAHGSMIAVDHVDLAVDPGQVVALLGANGAGKTSLLKAVMGLVRPRAGRIRLGSLAIDGFAPERRVRLGLGYAPEGRRVFAGMSVRDNLAVAGPGDAAERDQRIAEVYRLFPQLEALEPLAAWRLSGGQQQMLAIGRALMGGPRVLLLDEPSLGLAPSLVNDVLGQIRRIAAQGTTVLLAEQSVAAALDVADRIAVMRAGTIAFTGTVAEARREPLVERAFFGS